MRMYNVVLKATKKEFIVNEKLPLLKKKYEEYLNSVELVTEKQLIVLFKTGRVARVEHVGTLYKGEIK